MKLVLVRHGIALDLDEMRTSRARDAERPLTAEGRRKVTKAAKALRELGVRPDVVIHSGLVRARETAERIAAQLRPRRKALVVSATLLPDADPHDFLLWLASSRLRSIVAVGHAPNLDRLLACACGAGDRLITNLGKAGAAGLELPDVGRGGGSRGPCTIAGRLVWLLTPKLLRRFAP